MSGTILVFNKVVIALLKAIHPLETMERHQPSVTSVTTLLRNTEKIIRKGIRDGMINTVLKQEMKCLVGIDFNRHSFQSDN